MCGVRLYRAPLCAWGVMPRMREEEVDVAKGHSSSLGTKLGCSVVRVEVLGAQLVKGDGAEVALREQGIREAWARHDGAGHSMVG